MKKFNKILTIILFVLIAALGISCLVVYIIDPNLFEEWLDKVLDIVNRPIVIAGVSTTIGGLFVLFITKYITNNLSFGKNKIEQYDERVKQIEQAKEDLEKSANEKIKELEENNRKIVHYLYDICELSTNNKIKNYGKELLSYGEETIDSEPKA